MAATLVSQVVGITEKLRCAARDLNPEPTDEEENSARVDVIEQHEIAEADHRILNPLTDGKLMLIGRGVPAPALTTPIGSRLRQGRDAGPLGAQFGISGVFVGVATAANAGVPNHRAGLAAALLNASQQLGGALGLAIFSAIATARTSQLLTAHVATPNALTSGFHRALLASSILLAAALFAVRAPNTRGDNEHA